MSRWDDVALEKLRNVVGPKAAAEILARTMGELGRSELADPDALYAFAQALLRKGGFVGAVGGLLSVHAAIHGASRDPRAQP